MKIAPITNSADAGKRPWLPNPALPGRPFAPYLKPRLPRGLVYADRAEWCQPWRYPEIFDYDELRGIYVDKVAPPWWICWRA